MARINLSNWVWQPVHHVLIAAYPILFLVSINLGEVDPREAFLPTVASIGIAIALFVVLHLVGLPARRSALVVSVLAVVFFMFGHVAGALEPMGLTGWPLLAGWLVAGVVLIGVVLVVPGDLRAPTGLLNIVSGILVAFALASVAEHVLTEPDLWVGGQQVAAAGSEATPPPPRDGAQPRDIYYLMVEDYGAPRNLIEHLDVPDDGIYDWLADAGFTVLRDTRSNYGRTPLSVASSMNMIYLDELAAEMGPDEPSHRPLDRMVRNAEVVSFLKDRGYSYVLLGSQYYLTDNSEMADVNPIFAQTSDFLAVLSESTILPSIANLLGAEDELSDRRRVYDAAVWGLDTFPELVELPGPKFVFLHLYLPHPPWVVGEDGEYVTREADEERSWTERYRSQWSFVRGQMKALIEGLLDGPDETRPIIIYTTDEGPNPRGMPEVEGNIDWSNATDEQLDLKLSIFTAYHLPGVSDDCLYPGMSSVNTFRLVFNLYFDAGLPLLADRNYIHRDRSHPYDLTDVTDRLSAESAGSDTPRTCDS